MRPRRWQTLLTAVHLVPRLCETHDMFALAHLALDALEREGDLEEDSERLAEALWAYVVADTLGGERPTPDAGIDALAAHARTAR